MSPYITHLHCHHFLLLKFFVWCRGQSLPPLRLVSFSGYISLLSCLVLRDSGECPSVSQYLSHFHCCHFSLSLFPRFSCLGVSIQELLSFTKYLTRTSTAISLYSVLSRYHHYQAESSKWSKRSKKSKDALIFCSRITLLYIMYLSVWSFFSSVLCFLSSFCAGVVATKNPAEALHAHTRIVHSHWFCFSSYSVFCLPFLCYSGHVSPESAAPRRHQPGTAKTKHPP